MSLIKFNMGTIPPFKFPPIIKENTIILGALSGIALGTFSYNVLNADQQRYPVATEYQILKTCIDASKRPLPYHIYGKKERICICALEDTLKVIPLAEFKKDQVKFLSQFSLNAKMCSRK